MRGRLDRADVGDAHDREALARVVDPVPRGPEPDVTALPHPRPQLDVAEAKLLAELAAKRLLGVLEGDLSLDAGRQLAAELDRRDQVFPDLLPAISAAASGSRSIALA